MGAALRRAASFVVMVTVLAGCGSGATREKHLAAADARCAEIYAEANLAPLAGKIAGPESGPSSAAMTLAERPDAAERDAVGRYAQVIAQCRAVQDAVLGPPNAAEEQARKVTDGLLRRLHDGAISFGEYNRGIALAHTQRTAEAEDEQIRQMRRSLSQPVFPPQGPPIYCGHNAARPYC